MVGSSSPLKPTSTTDHTSQLSTTMHCSFSLFLFSLLISLPSTSTTPHVHPNNQPKPNTMDPSELQTLFNIMDTLSSDQTWKLSHPNPCTPGQSWVGIECKPGLDKKLHVSRLDFGTPPNPTCKNTSTFPTQIFRLPYLQSVFFFNCFTHTKTILSFPRIPYSSLEQLSLRSNPSLIGPIPPQISSLVSLQILTLSQNHLTGLIPPQISSLKSLVHLDLSYNELSGTIPYQLCTLTNLIGLDLSYNSLVGPIPNTIGQMGVLQKVDLSSNLLTGSIPNSIEKLTSLEFIALSNNKLRGKLPKGITKLKSLQYFIMDDNPMFISLPIEFGQLKTLQELRVANCGYSGTIPSTFSLLMNLSTLSLQNNRLTGGIPSRFGDLSHIYHLNLSRNYLGGMVPFSDSFLKRLGKNLDLSGNVGLCLSPSEAAYGVKVGVNVCGKGSNITGSIMKPLKKSEAPIGCNSSLFLLFSTLGVLVLPQIFFPL